VEIIVIKKMMDYRNRYDNGSGKWFKGNKDDMINEGCELIKKMICDLAKKYEAEAT